MESRVRRFSSSQKTRLMRKYDESSYITRKEAERLAQDLSLSETQVLQWFRTTRSRKKETSTRTGQYPIQGAVLEELRRMYDNGLVYPRKQEKEEIARRYGIGLVKIDGWFKRERRRRRDEVGKRPNLSKEQEMKLLEIHKETPVISQDDYPEIANSLLLSSTSVGNWFARKKILGRIADEGLEGVNMYTTDGSSSSNRVNEIEIGGYRLSREGSVFLEDFYAKEKSPSRKDKEWLSSRLNVSPVVLSRWFSRKRHANGDTKVKSISEGVRSQLMSSYLETNYPSNETKAELAASTGLDVHQVEIWYANQRHKRGESLGNRATLTKDQKKLLEDAFQDSHFPSKEERIRLANLCSLSMDQLSNWFAKKRFRLVSTPLNEFSSDIDVKGVQWAPDGSCLLCSAEDMTVRLLEVPWSSFSTEGVDFVGAEEEEGEVLELSIGVRVSFGAIVYDYCWYPKMNTYVDPTTAHFLTSSRGVPVQMWNAYTGKLETAFKSFERDELRSAISVGFTPDGEHVCCGFKGGEIHIFSTKRPSMHVTYTSKEYSSPRGIVGCLGFSKADPDLVVAGSYRGELVALDLKSRESVWWSEDVVKTGFSQIEFSLDGVLLFAARRKGGIVCYDLRTASDDGEGEPVCQYWRKVSNNQHMRFCLKETGAGTGGAALYCGNQTGEVYKYRVAAGNEPEAVYDLGYNCVNSIEFHPWLSLAALSSGTREYHRPKPPPVNMDTVNSADSDSDTSDANSEKESPITLPRDFSNEISLWKE